MNKISFKKRSLKEVEKLSREQLKNVLGVWCEESGSDGGRETIPYSVFLCQCIDEVGQWTLTWCTGHSLETPYRSMGAHYIEVG